jgi:toluene monooxygenase system ferredoxin subunit
MGDAAVHWFEVPEAENLWEGDLVDAEVAGEQVLIVHHLDGTFVAYQGLCPHQEVLLADGKWDEESGVLACGGHAWEFDMRSGAGLNPLGCRLYRYPVEVEGGVVRVGIPQDGRPHHSRFRDEGET